MRRLLLDTARWTLDDVDAPWKDIIFSTDVDDRLVTPDSLRFATARLALHFIHTELPLNPYHSLGLLPEAHKREANVVPQREYCGPRFLRRCSACDRRRLTPLIELTFPGYPTEQTGRQFSRCVKPGRGDVAPTAT